MESEIKSVFKVKGMDCADEVAAIQKALKKQYISAVDVNLMASQVTVLHGPKLEKDELKTLIETSGVKVVEEESRGFRIENALALRLVVASGIFLGIGLVLEWTGSHTMLSLAGYAFATMLAGYLVLPKALRALSKRTLDINVLMSIAVVGAIVIKQYSEAATVIFLFAIAELLEAYSVARARRAIKDLLKITPKMTVVEREGKGVETLVEDVKIGDVILVRPGERISLDGTVARGESSVNQAPLTGESKLVDKKTGDKVFAGTLNETGLLAVNVENIFANTKLSKIIHMVEEAQQQKAPSQRFVDKFAQIYTPAVFVLAILVAVVPPLMFSASWDQWFYKALVLLVIACPCALVIATSVSVVSGLASLARRGVLVKGGTYLEDLGRLKAIALDKTGTITEGKPRIQSFKGFSDQSEPEVLALAASLESVSTHPLARAILTYAKSKNISPVHPTEYAAIPGKGAQGKIGPHFYFVGNHNFAHGLGVCSTEIEAYLHSLEEQAQSVVIVGHAPHESCKGDVLGIFGVGDSIRLGASESVKELHRVGVSRVVMLSGDNDRTVQAIAKNVGLDEAKGELLPEDKVAAIKNLVEKFGKVGMVGDGINDAPALAQATVGIAMGAAGSDAAIETADVALMRDDIGALPTAIRQGRNVVNMIRFNISFALGIKVVFLVLTFIGFANLWLAVAADAGASLFVTFNALRLLRSPG